MDLLRSSTHPRWFGAGRAHLGALLSDHLHCERKAVENALSLVRRYPRGHVVERLVRLAHEETSHLVQVAALLRDLGLTVRADGPNHYTRALFAEVRGREPDRLVDALLCSALIEARSHERLSLLATGFGGEGNQRLSAFYGALAGAEERHAELFVELALEAAPASDVHQRLAWLTERESEILAALPHGPRIH